MRFRSEVLPRQRRHISFGLIADANHRGALESEAAQLSRSLAGVKPRHDHDAGNMDEPETLCNSEPHVVILGRAKRGVEYAAFAEADPGN